LFHLAFLLLATFHATVAHAAIPDVEFLFPSGGQQGTSVKVTASNKADSKITPWPAKVWIDCPGVEFTASDKPGIFNVTIAKDAPLGPHSLRIFNADGASPPRLFVVGRHPEIIEKEPNDDMKSAQVVKELPAVVNGALDKPGDVDFYALDVEAGKWLVAELRCRRLGSPCDPALRLVDDKGVVVAFNHDTFGLDPLVAYQATKGGRFYIQVVGFPFPPGSDIKFAGAKSIVYRLNVTTDAYARLTFPACVPRDRVSTVSVLGWNFCQGAPFCGESLMQADTTHLSREDQEIAFGKDVSDGVASLPLVNLAGARENEPNDTPDHAQTVEVPGAIDGRMDKPGDVDCFAFDAKAGKRYTLRLLANSLNSPVDPMLVLTDPSGSELIREVGAGQDIRLEWTAKTAGRHVIAVTDIKRGGGNEYVYHLEIDNGTPDFTARVDATAYRIQVGKTAKVVVTVTKLNAHAAPLKIEAGELPDGISVEAADVPAKGGAVTFVLSASAEAKPANQPIRIVVRGTEKDHSITRRANFESADALTLSTNTIWLTVTTGPALPEPKKKKK
jgi:hypothetical protein